jgi:hypothetical protein
MRQSLGGRERFTVSPEATWTLNALAGGYCREVVGAGVMMPKTGVHATVAQALECMGRGITAATLESTDGAELNGTTRGGAKYRSMIR